jgi:hypothetical protein
MARESLSREHRSLRRSYDEQSTLFCRVGASRLLSNSGYYFFSPADQSAAKDVAVLNRIWREGKLGVVGIPVSGKDEEIGNYVNEAKPLFPIRRSDAEVKLVKPAETPDLYLALPLEKKMIRLGPTITETAIAETIGNILAAQFRGEPSLDPLASSR